MRQMSDPNMLTMMLTVAHPVTTDTGFASKGFAADYHGAYMIKRGGKECLDISEGAEHKGRVVRGRSVDVSVA